jgi:hypothetical protein
VKKITTLAMAALLSLAPFTLRAQNVTPPTAATASAIATLVASIRNAPAANRQKLVQDAIKADPTISSALVAALITSFPTEAASYTKTVVDAVIGLTLSNEAKSTILTAVASSAVPAALALPPALVTDLVASVNAVKSALANVPPQFAPAVAQYTTPIVGVIIAENGTIQEIVSASSL